MGTFEADSIYLAGIALIYCMVYFCYRNLQPYAVVIGVLFLCFVVYMLYRCYSTLNMDVWRDSQEYLQTRSALFYDWHGVHTRNRAPANIIERIAEHSQHCEY